MPASTRGCGSCAGHPVKGYVGVGIVKEKARPVADFEVEIDGARMPIVEAPLAEPEKVRHDADNPELAEHLVRVEWVATRPIDEAAWQTGLFTNQIPVCKLRDTIEYLEGAFELTSGTPPLPTSDADSQAVL